MQRRIERTGLHLQHVAGNLLDAEDDAPAVHRLERQGLEDEQVQRALQQVGRFGHEVGPYIRTIESKAKPSLDCQEKPARRMTDTLREWGFPIGSRGHGAAGRYDGRVRPPFAVEPGTGQESVWDYPRPPRLAAEPREVIVRVGTVIVGRSVNCLRVLETASPPTIYLPPGDVDRAHLEPSAGASMCEWKGEARYWTVVANGQRLSRVGWSYPHPFAEFEPLADFVALLPRPPGVSGRRRPRPPAAGRFLWRLDHAGDRRTLQGRAGHGGVVRELSIDSSQLRAISRQPRHAASPLEP